MQYGEDWSEFTEQGFRSLLKALKQGGYRFAEYGEPAGEREVIWRHDVDVSIHRAAKLGAIEAEEGVRSTYFINPRSIFYSLAEPQIVRLVRGLAEAGHALGLHFDAEAYATVQWSEDQLEAAVAAERRLMELTIGAPIASMSWHNPGFSNLLDFGGETVAGLVNAYSESYRANYVYCSDSNGYWRFTPMGEVIAKGHSRLHLLTHPEWWTPEPMTPSQRIDRAVNGRTQALAGVRPDLPRPAGYDKVMDASLTRANPSPVS